MKNEHIDELIYAMNNDIEDIADQPDIQTTEISMENNLEDSVTPTMEYSTTPALTEHSPNTSILYLESEGGESGVITQQKGVAAIDQPSNCPPVQANTQASAVTPEERSEHLEIRGTTACARRKCQRPIWSRLAQIFSKQPVSVSTVEPSSSQCSLP